MASATGLKIGTKAPAFTLLNQDSQKKGLKDYAGHWLVLYFYPRDLTPGCTTEACDFTARRELFSSQTAVVVGVSPDTPATHQKFIAKHQLTVELLSDPEHAALVKYGAWGEKNMYGKKVQGVIRSTVIIDPQGKVAFHWPNVKATGHAQAVAEKLAELQSQS